MMRDPGGSHPDDGNGAPPNPPPGDSSGMGGLVLFLLFLWLLLAGYGVNELLKLLGFPL